MSAVQRRFGWSVPGPGYAHRYLLPAVVALIERHGNGRSLSVADLGCGNGFAASQLAARGHDVVGIDVSPDEIEIARGSYPHIDFRVVSIYDEALPDSIGPVDCVVSLEVIEHLFYPRLLLTQAYRLLKPGGIVILSTPYHGYVKNLVLSFLNAWDNHFDVGRDGGHIKFFSRRTVSHLALDAGFTQLRFRGAGRIPGLWKSMIMTAEK